MEQNRRDFLKFFGKITAGIGLTSLGGGFPLSRGEGAMTSADRGWNFWERVRERHFSLSYDSIYMNNSTFGPTLKPVQNRMREVQKIFSEGCNLDIFVSDVLMYLSPMREKFRQLVNGYDDGSMKGRYIGNVDSVTEGMSLIANGITFRSGDTILITDHEHTGGRTMWELQRDRYGAQLIEIPLVVDGEPEEVWKENLLNRFETALNQYPVKVMSFSLVTTSTGHILPAKELCALARQKGAISVIDAAQAFAVLPLDIMDLDCDYFVVNGHKYLCGPIGSGFVVVHPSQIESLSSFWPTVVDENYYHPENLARHYPHRKGGVVSYTNLLPLYEALSFYENLGVQKVYDRLFLIGQSLRTALSMFPDYFDLVTPMNPELSCVMTCFRIKNMDSQEVYEILKDQYSIHVKCATEGGANAVRIAPHYYNTQDEFNRLGLALSDIAGIKVHDRSAFLKGLIGS